MSTQQLPRGNHAKPPYSFVPIEPAHAVTDEPQWHDVLDLDNNWTGELHCELTALTPLLAANDQYQIRHDPEDTKNPHQIVAQDEVVAAFDKLLRDRFKTAETPQYKRAKKVLEPLLSPGEKQGEPGPALIAGAAIKGMLRQSLSALLSAPMERVQERTYSFRPNVRLDPEKDDHLLSRVGVVSRAANGGVVIVPLDGLEVVCYIEGRAEQAVLQAWGGENGYRTALDRLREAGSSREFPRDAAALFRASLPLRDCEMAEQRGRYKLRARRGGWATINRGVYLLPYRFGLDGQGVFNQAFHNTDDRRGYRYVLVYLPAKPTTITLGKDLVEHWRETIRHLRDQERGHLVSHPNLRERTDRARAALQQLLDEDFRPGDLVFFEQEAAPGRVVTLGHHFRYRWRYRDTIRHTETASDRTGCRFSAAPDLRDILCPRPLEMTADADGRPQELSAARLLFGYVSTEKGEYRSNEPTTFGIGLKPHEGKPERSDFAQMAGRVAVNIAVEQDTGRPLDQRFLNAQPEYKCLVPLRPLGSPKPSAVEHYVSQDRKGLRHDAGLHCTYGDTADDDSAGQLRGRKFYLHQPLAADDANGAACYELRGPEDADWKSGDTFHLAGDQAVVARFVSRTGTRFRFTVRFVNLRPWELGALLFALTPTRTDLAELAKNLPDADILKKWQELHPGEPLLAHKLGHGRPVGLGSVEVKVERLTRLRKDDAQLVARDDATGDALAARRRELIAVFADRLKTFFGAGVRSWAESILRPWLEVHRWVGRTYAEYPRDQKKQTEPPTIYDYHSQLRAKHAGGRKKKK